VSIEQLPFLAIEPNDSTLTIGIYWYLLYRIMDVANQYSQEQLMKEGKLNQKPGETVKYHNLTSRA
jgi:hypothetical protein